MQIEYGNQKVNLFRCPFCGSTPLIHSYRNRMKQWFRIRCSNDTEICRIMPETMAHLKLVDAATDWNQRDWNQVPGTKEDTE